MKYIDADKLIAEIERLKNQTERRLDNIVPIRKKDTMDEEQLAKIELRDKVDKAYLNGVLITLSDVLSCITSLQQEQPSLPSNLDEAAKKAYKEYDVKTALKPKEHPVGFLFFDGFKAGAEWMARQGINAESEVCKLAERAWVTPIDEKQLQRDLYDNFVAGDKVIVQIRKK